MQNFGHVDHQFSQSFASEDGPKWNLVDSNGNKNVVSYNMDLQYTAMTESSAYH